MKVARIEKTGKQAVTLFLITGICLLANKGIVPIGLIALLLLTGGLMDLLFSLLFLVVKIMAVLAVLGLLFSLTFNLCKYGNDPIHPAGSGRSGSLAPK